jgi:hypothetical protein
MKSVLFVIFLLGQVISMPLYAQVSRSVAHEQINYLKRESILSASGDTYKNIKGTPYMKDEFAEGKIYTKGGDVFPGEYRFDIYANKVQFMNQGVTFQVAHPDSIAKIEIGELTLKYVEYLNGGEQISKAFMIVLEDGNYILLEQKNKVFYEALPGKPYQDPEPAKFGTGKDFFFLKVGDRPAEKITGTKDIIRICGDKGSEAKSYMDEEKLSVKKVDDLITLINHLNKLD